MACDLDERKCHVYVVPRCVRIGTHNMGLVYEVLSRFASHARHRYLQLDFDAESIGNRTDAHGSVDRNISGDSDFVARSNELHCTDKARAVTGGKKLFGVGAFLALSTQ